MRRPSRPAILTRGLDRYKSNWSEASVPQRVVTHAGSMVFSVVAGSAAVAATGNPVVGLGAMVTAAAITEASEFLRDPPSRGAVELSPEECELYAEVTLLRAQKIINESFEQLREDKLNGADDFTSESFDNMLAVFTEPPTRNS
jgi:hypothetical protein